MDFSSIIRIVTPSKGALAGIVVLLLAVSGLALVQPILAGQLVDAVVRQPAGWLGDIYQLLLIWFVLVVARAFLQFVSTYRMASLSEAMYATLRNRAFEHAQSLPLSWHQDRQSGETVSLLTQDTSTVSTFVTTTLVGFIPSLLMLIGAVVMMFTISPELALLATLLLPVYYFIIKLVGRRMRRYAREVLDAHSARMGYLQEHFSLVALVKAFGREPEERERNLVHDRRLSAGLRRQAGLTARISPLATLLATCGLLILVLLGVGQIEAGTLDTGALVSLLFYALLMNQPVAALADGYGRVQAARGSAERLQALFATRPEPLDEGDGEALTVSEGAIRFEGIRFAYPGRAAVLDGFDLEIPGGKTTVITGPNGAGKTTLVNLLLRFVDPEAGRITIDGQPIDDLRLTDLRAAVGLVPQFTLLINGTVADNLRYGKWDARHEEMREACRAAGALEFIEELPQGLETQIGDQGVRLSGGQRQRLSLARTLLKDPPIIVLDEATSMLDPVGHSAVIEELRKVLEGKTVVLITHQEENRAIADHEVVLDGVTAQGETETASAKLA